jgi:uroporphyrinogen III methyltransferase/synthase
MAQGHKVLLARADRGRTLLRDELQHKAQVHQVAVYHNIDTESLPDQVLARIQDGSVDWITLTSSAIATRFHALLPAAIRPLIGREIRLATLSPVTSETVVHLGWNVAVEAREYHWQGLVESIVQRLEAEREGSQQPE